MNNYISKKTLSQAFFEDKSQLALLIADFLLKLKSKYKHIFPSQGNIALWVGCSRKTVNEILDLFDQEGWFKKVRRGTRQTCIYIVSTKFNLIADFPEARKKLPGLVNYYYSLIMEFFSGFGKSLVKPFSEKKSSKVTPYIEENSIITSSSVSVSKGSHSLSVSIDKLFNKLNINMRKEDQENMIYKKQYASTTNNRKIDRMCASKEERILLQAMGYYDHNVNVQVDRPHKDKKVPHNE